jgi:hypothetical protein
LKLLGDLWFGASLPPDVFDADDSAAVEAVTKNKAQLAFVSSGETAYRSAETLLLLQPKVQIPFESLFGYRPQVESPLSGTTSFFLV